MMKHSASRVGANVNAPTQRLLLPWRFIGAMRNDVRVFR